MADASKTFGKKKGTQKTLRSAKNDVYNACSPDLTPVIPSESNSEWLTRKRLIDPKLKAAGWHIVPFSPATSANYDSCAIEEFETANGPADYALCAEGRIIGIVEAKKLTLGPQSVLTQAETCCKGRAVLEIS